MFLRDENDNMTPKYWSSSPLLGSFVEPYTLDIRKALEPLLENIRCYDAVRQKLELHGGQVSDLERITTILNKKISIQGRFWKHEVTLTVPESLRDMLSDVGSFDLHLQVRMLDSQMPVYYICRTQRDFWFDYSLIVEDLYLSPGYPMADERFVKLMSFGHEAYYLRLSQFRGDLCKMLSEEKETSELRLDQTLYELGRHIFQAAWHEDQQLAFLTSRSFSLPCFRYAIELLYLCLTGDLCELRSAMNQSLERFLREVYGQPAIHNLLQILPHLDGSTLNDMPQKAQKLYVKLSKAFGKFLQTEVTWGWRKSPVPLYKLIYGNVSRLSQVGKMLQENEKIVTAKRQLEEAASGVIDDITRG